MAAIRATDRPNAALRARGLLVDQKGVGAPTVAGLVVLELDPLVHVPEAYVRLLRYRGSTREIGARSNVIQNVRLTGPIPAATR